MSTVKEKKFYWNEDTLNYFKFVSNYENKKQVIEEITDFVEYNCSLEDNVESFIPRAYFFPKPSSLPCARKPLTFSLYLW